MKRIAIGGLAIALLAGTSWAAETHAHLDTGHLPAFRRDRGAGVSLSAFGTYIQKGQVMIYPFFEYYYDDDFEYAPSDFVSGALDKDFRGKYRATEELLMFAAGLTENLAVEFEFAIIQTRFEKDKSDGTTDAQLPPVREEDGLGDVEGQIRYRWAGETDSRPEIFSYFETVIPTQDEGSLIGTTDWEFKLGSGLIRGFSWGTLTGRASIAYDKSEEVFELGEMSIEYLRRLSSKWRVYGAVEGTQDEVELLTEAQFHFSRHAFLKLNNGFGLTSKATGWAPEIGVLLTL